MIDGLGTIDLKNLTIEQLADLQKQAVAEMKAKQKEEIYSSPEYLQAKEWAKPLEEELEALENGIEERKNEIRVWREKSKELREEIKSYFSERNLPIERKEGTARTYNASGHRYDIEFLSENAVKFTIKQNDEVLATEELKIDPVKKTVPSHVVEDFLKRNNIETAEGKSRGISFRIKKKYANHFKEVNAQ